MKEWFASWFDTHYYHILYKDRDKSEAESFIRNLFQFLEIDKSSDVLDLACGKGRHAVFINSLGYKTTGVDLSPDSIKKASESANDSLNFFVHDMRNPLPEKNFNLVVNLFTSFGYFNHVEENQKVLNSIHSYLSKDGLLVIDFLNAKYVADNLVEREVKEIEGIKFEITKSIVDGCILKDIVFEDKGEKFAFQEKVQALGLKDFETILSKENFEIIHVFGDYELAELNESSDRLIIIAKKK